MIFYCEKDFYVFIREQLEKWIGGTRRGTLLQDGQFSALKEGEYFMPLWAILKILDLIPQKSTFEGLGQNF